MKTFSLIVCFLFTSLGLSQTKYTSPFTENILQPNVEAVEREISISESVVTIITKTEDGKDIQRLFIKSLEFSPPGPYAEFLILHCTSMNEKVQYHVVIPQTLPIEFLDVVIPKQDSLPFQHWRFHLDI